MTNGQIEAALLGQSARVGDDCQSVHLQLVVVVEAQRLIDPDTRIQFEATLFQTVLASGMAGVQDGHIVLLCQCVDSSKQAQEVLFGIDVLLTVGGQQNILILFQPQTLQHMVTMTFLPKNFGSQQKAAGPSAWICTTSYGPKALQSAAKKEEVTAASPFLSMVGTVLSLTPLYLLTASASKAEPLT